MHFCDKCGNMYYIRLTSEDKTQLVYYCRKCGNINDMDLDETLAITSSELVLKAVVEGIDQAAFDAAVTEAKDNCPISKLYNTTITVESTLN